MFQGGQLWENLFLFKKYPHNFYTPISQHMPSFPCVKWQNRSLEKSLSAPPRVEHQVHRVMQI
jgi:hypothetical protein